MMKINKIAGALALITSLVTASGVAQASTTYLTNPSADVNYGVLTSPETANVYEIDLTTPGLDFINTFTFIVNANSLVDAYAENNITQVTKTTNTKVYVKPKWTTVTTTTTTTTKNIDSLAISLYDTNDAEVGPTNIDGSYVLSSGNYYAKVTGKTSGDQGGTYSVVMSAQPVPVPAAAWLLGSGLIGLVAVARRKEPA